MISAEEARKLSEQGVIDQKILKKVEKKARRESHFQEERNKNSQRIKEAEQKIHLASLLGERKVELPDYIEMDGGCSDPFTDINHLIEPHMELVNYFRELGYTVLLGSEIDTNSDTLLHCLILCW